MSILIKTQIMLLKSKIRRIKPNYLFTACICFGVIYSLLMIGAFYIFGNYPVFSKTFLCKYIFWMICYFYITYLPITIYKTFVVNKDFDILFLAPISLKDCFIWNFLRKTVPHILCGILFALLFLPIMLKLGIPFFIYIINIFILIVFMHIIYIILEMILYGLAGRHLYKCIMFILGIEEILLFFIVLDIFNGNVHWLNCINFEYFLYENNIFHYLKIIGILCILFIAGYLCFKMAYYTRGCCNTSNGKAALNYFQFIETKNSFYLLKDEKIFLRDFERLKYVFVTVLIYIFTTLIGTNRVNASSVFIALLTFYFILGIQITLENISAEKKKCELFILSELKLVSFILHKYRFSLFNTLITSLIYALCLIWTNHVSFLEGVEIIVISTQIIIFSCYIFCFDLAIIFIKIWSEASLFDKVKAVLKKFCCLVGKIICVVGLYIIIYFASLDFMVKIILQLLTSIMFAVVCIRKYKKYECITISELFY